MNKAAKARRRFRGWQETKEFPGSCGKAYPGGTPAKLDDFDAMIDEHLEEHPEDEHLEIEREMLERRGFYTRDGGSSWHDDSAISLVRMKFGSMKVFVGNRSIGILASRRDLRMLLESLGGKR